MKKYIITLLFAACLSAPAFADITAEDLDGKFYGAFQGGTVYEKTAPKEQFSGYFELRGSQLYMCDFWRGFDLPVSISNNVLTLSDATVYGESDLRFPGLPMRIFRNKRYTANGGYYIDYGYSTSSLGPVTFTLNENPILECLYNFVSTKINRLRIKLADGSMAESQGEGFQIYVFNTNASVIEYTQRQVTDHYRVDIQFNDDSHTMGTIKNWAAWGVNFITSITSAANNCKLKWTDVTFNYDNETATVPRQIIGSDIIPYTDYIGTGTMHGYYADWDRYYGDLPAVRHMYTASGKSGSGSDIVGKIRGRNPRHTRGTETLWAKTCGGGLETHLTMDLAFPANQTYQSGTQGYVDSTLIETTLLYEYTHDASLDIKKFGYDRQNGLFVHATLAGSQRDRYVDSYELYAVPGKYTSINDPGFMSHLDLGHVSAVRMDAGSRKAPAMQPDAADADAPLEFSRLLKPSQMPADWDRDNTDYTFFLKASYNPATGLAPTFHALTTRDINTGVESLVAEAEATVSARAGRIVIEGTEAPARVYTMTGATVYSGTDRSIAVAPGTYIVTIGTRSHKIAVR